MKSYILAFKNYGNFAGRSRRRDYWHFVLTHTLLVLGLAVLAAIIPALVLLYFAYIVGSIIPCISIATRRLHDTNRSGWFQLISMIPFVGPFILLYFMCEDSTPGQNQYGANPKEIVA